MVECCVVQVTTILPCVVGWLEKIAVRVAKQAKQARTAALACCRVGAWKLLPTTNTRARAVLPRSICNLPVG